MQGQQKSCRNLLTAYQFRKFLQIFKTKDCHETHSILECCNYHVQPAMTEKNTNNQNQGQTVVSPFSSDKRRNPYGKLNTMAYSSEFCANYLSCFDEACPYCHNSWEYNFHPLIFKTAPCDHFYNCTFELCPNLHCTDYATNPKTQISTFKFSQFFRFDIMTFKSCLCQKQYAHDKNSCLYYHNQADYRRPDFETYGHIKCKKANEGVCYDIKCSFAHNKIEQLYHPSRYKSKFCESHFSSRKKLSQSNNGIIGNYSECPYEQFCSFAHDDSEISVELIDRLEKNQEFYLYSYKTVWCPMTTDHNRYHCVYAHNIQDFRRNPKNHSYEPIDCPFWKKNENIKNLEEAGCPTGMSCTKCHGWKQKQYHPLLYCKAKAIDSQKHNSESFNSSDGCSKTQSPNAQRKKKSEIIMKKLGADFNPKTHLQSIVQTLYNKNNPKKHLYLPGAPFFKSKSRGKMKSRSEKGDAFDESDEKAFKEEANSVQTTKSIQARGSYKEQKNSQEIDDNQIFKVFESGNQRTCDEKRSCINWTDKNKSQRGKQENEVEKPVRTVSKSVGFTSRGNMTNYSKDLSEQLTPQILQVLKNKNISEIKLINMKEQDIRKMDELTNSQKNLIINKILTTKDIARKTPTYENIFEKVTRSITQFFIKHRQQDILAKMKSKKVKQEMLLLLDSEIKQLSFLSESEKTALPKIIAEFKDDKQFEQLSVDIVRSISNEGDLIKK